MQIPPVHHARVESELRKTAKKMQPGQSVLLMKETEARYLCTILGKFGFKGTMRTLVIPEGKYKYRVWKLKRK